MMNPNVFYIKLLMFLVYVMLNHILSLRSFTVGQNWINKFFLITQNSLDNQRSIGTSLLAKQAYCHAVSFLKYI